MKIKKQTESLQQVSPLPSKLSLSLQTQEWSLYHPFIGLVQQYKPPH
jgi:hypothetical protein